MAQPTLVAKYRDGGAPWRNFKGRLFVPKMSRTPSERTHIRSKRKPGVVPVAFSFFAGSCCDQRSIASSQRWLRGKLCERYAERREPCSAEHLIAHVFLECANLRCLARPAKHRLSATSSSTQTRCTLRVGLTCPRIKLIRYICWACQLVRR